MKVVDGGERTIFYKEDPEAPLVLAHYCERTNRNMIVFSTYYFYNIKDVGSARIRCHTRTLINVLPDINVLWFFGRTYVFGCRTRKNRGFLRGV
ncbi:MAG: hypothetical protein UX57_C0001G0026 [Candidatus Uhrbacteria bacterium GW2011_GWE2_46_68]|uniref:Uncharacterized protein n=2 Tax=Candidatus Uhriibacteriota TaxID=1752732 RepID=A0A0G1QAH9_9BACT|nr:MAG: hypothetical protein UX45_C0002G0027 [Candidatus Uhrbacteria bacterium GW2011_GWF2_46_218]KKU41802.1 MAG: hypothetical protein UX57_C0001G0026 [Candidatus Uhrbacteria bacterium GW2011_GWE2_46_68]